mmetsp:Transcript_44619/g.139930  ORF Transcript_44619/g.139930 Transcript_44619/m.139930 type:complete len:229 (+) Transcript_44619:275-961(+)
MRCNESVGRQVCVWCVRSRFSAAPELGMGLPLGSRLMTPPACPMLSVLVTPGPLTGASLTCMISPMVISRFRTTVCASEALAMKAMSLLWYAPSMRPSASVMGTAATSCCSMRSNTSQSRVVASMLRIPLYVPMLRSTMESSKSRRCSRNCATRKVSTSMHETMASSVTSAGTTTPRKRCRAGVNIRWQASYTEASTSTAPNSPPCVSRDPGYGPPCGGGSEMTPRIV